MTDWRLIETLVDFPYMEQVLVCKPGGPVHAMKAVLARRPERGFTHWMPAPEPPPAPEKKSRSYKEAQVRAVTLGLRTQIAK